LVRDMCRRDRFGARDRSVGDPFEGRPRQQEALLADAREADDGLGLVAVALDEEDDALAELGVPDVVADAQTHGLGTRVGGPATGVDGGVDDALATGVAHALGPRLPARAAAPAVGAVRRTARRAPAVAEVLDQFGGDLVEEP